MIRPFTFICMIGALGSGLYLYQCKHQAQMLDREIARTLKQTDATRDRIVLLKADWQQLNQPDRLRDLSRAHTTLQTARPTQFVSASDLATKLPAPVAPAAPTQTTDMTPEEAPAVESATTTPPEPQAAAQAAPAVVAHAASVVAPAAAAAEPRRAEARPAPVRQAARPAPSHVAAAQAAPQAPARQAAAEPANQGTIGASVLRTVRAHEQSPPYVQPVAAPSTPQRAYVAPAYAAPAYAPPPAPAYSAATGGSMLGGSHGALPPPVPFAAR